MQTPPHDGVHPKLGEPVLLASSTELAGDVTVGDDGLSTPTPGREERS